MRELRAQKAASGALLVPWTRTSTGQHSLAVYGAIIWNRLVDYTYSSSVARTNALSASKRQLKTHLSVPELD